MRQVPDDPDHLPAIRGDSENLTRLVEGLYIRSPDQPVGPRILRADGVILNRFMDYFYIQGTPGSLTPKQIFELNLARRELINEPQLSRINLRVKEVLGAALAQADVVEVLEWGCGYDTILPFLSNGMQWTGIDIDPHVVQYHVAHGRVCHLAEPGFSVSSHASQFDAIVAIFVLHFAITDADIQAIARFLKPSGVFLGNVYHLDVAARSSLKQRFELHGMTTVLVQDKEHLCSAHEYWLSSQSAGDKIDQLVASL